MDMEQNLSSVFFLSSTFYKLGIFYMKEISPQSALRELTLLSLFFHLFISGDLFKMHEKLSCFLSNPMILNYDT